MIPPLQYPKLETKMKQVAAVLLVLAVFNPLCCCFAWGEDPVVETPMKADHSCCTTQSSNPESTNEQPDPSACEHEENRDTAITANAHLSIPFATLVAQNDLFQEAYDLKVYRESTGTYQRSYEAQQSVPRWVGIQTDCVRRL